MGTDPWITPLARALIGFLVLALLLVAAWWQFARATAGDEPFDSGLD